MPGLAAIITAPGAEAASTIRPMLRRMKHYSWLQSVEHIDQERGVGLGAVFLESHAAHVRATSADGDTVLFLDGELYDADKLRSHLRREGIESNTESHAELLLGALQSRPLEFLGSVDGVFTAVMWNRRSQELTVVTDRLGMRPAYAAEVPGGLVFGSEIKALLADARVARSLSQTGLSQFFAFGHFFNNDTLFTSIRALPAASYGVFRRVDGRFALERYWRPRLEAAPGTTSDQAVAVEEALVAAVHRCAGHGERLGLSLSGGLDARTILGLMPRPIDLTSVSIGIAGSMDHRSAARLASLAGVTHHSHVLDGSFLESFETHLLEMVRLTDGHYLDQGIVVPTLKTYRDLGIDVLLRGHGGELLHMRKAYAFSMDDEAASAPDVDLQTWLYSHLSHYMLHEVPHDLFTWAVQDSARKSLRVALGQTESMGVPAQRVWQLFLNERLHRETALSMHKFNCFAAVRLPYVDPALVELLLSLPIDLKLGDELQTRILTRRCPDFLTVPNSNTGVRPGAGAMVSALGRFRLRVSARLGLPGYQPYERLGLWLSKDLRPLVERVLLSEECLGRGLFSPDKMKSVIDAHVTARQNHTFLLMSLLIFEFGQRLLADPEGFAQGADLASISRS